MKNNTAATTNVATAHSSSSSLINALDSEIQDGCKSDILMSIMKIQPIFLLIFGFIANLCSFAVLIQPRLRLQPTFSYLSFLSLSNAFLSLIHAFFTTMAVYFRLTVENLSLFIFCRLLNRFLVDFLTHFSLYTLTAVDFHRCRTITSKANLHQHCYQTSSTRQTGCLRTFTRVCLIELCSAMILFFLNLHWLTSYGYTMSYNYFNNSIDLTMCTIPDKADHVSLYGKYLTTILPFIELIFFGMLPFSISFITTIIILRYVSIKYSSTNSLTKQLKQSRRRMELHLSILLISLNVVFILFTTPHNIFNVYVGHLHNKLQRKHESHNELCSVAITQKSLDLLQQCYFMSTFFLYILTNKRFREEFYRLVRCIIFTLCRRKNTNDVHRETTTYLNRKINQNNNNKNDINMNQNYLAPSSPNDVLDKWSSISDIHQEN